MRTLPLLLSCFLASVLSSALFGSVPSQFNAFIFEDFTCSGSDTEGRLYAGGNVALNGYGVGCQIYNPNPTQSTCISFGSVTCTALESESPAPFIYSLVAGEALSATSVQVYAGGVAYGTTENGDPNHVLDCPNVESTPIDLSTWQTYLTTLSTTLSAQAPTGNVTNFYGTLQFQGSNSALEFFSVKGSDLAAANGLSILGGIASGAFIYINVDGVTDSFQNLGTIAFQSYAPNVVWNFYQATTLTVGGVAIFGSVLAPLASIPNSNGVIWGQLIANSFTSTSSCAQINWIPFGGPVITGSTPVCGDGIVEAPETCDLGSNMNGLASSCCSSSCQLVPSPTVCRPAAGPCDYNETCDGVHPTCPPDQFKPATTPCGGLFGICDVQLERHCPGNAAPCFGAPPAPLWYWDAFNVISFNTYTCNGGDVEGRLAVRNQASLSGFTLGLNILTTDYYSLFALLVAQNATWTSGSVNNGYIGVGGIFSAPTYLTASQIQSYITTGQFDNAQTFYGELQTIFSGLGYNANASIIYNDGLLITCDNSTNILNHVQVDGATLSQVNWYILQNCLFTAGWIVDVTGTGDVTLMGSPFPGVVERVIFNVVGSGRTIFGQTGVSGNILAPYNSYSQQTGVTYGRLIVGDIPVARQNNKPNCQNFQNVVISNINLQAVEVGNDFIYVVNIGSYVVGDNVCFNGDCHTVTGGIIEDVNGDGVIENILVVTPPFTQSYSQGTIFSATINPNTVRVPLTPSVPVVQTTAHPMNGASTVTASFFLLALAFFLF